MIDRVEGGTLYGRAAGLPAGGRQHQGVHLPYYMARIVDFPAFVADYPFKADDTERGWRFSMTDPIMECNQGSFLLKISKDGRGDGCEDLRAVRRQHQHPDHDDHADGL